MTFTVDEILKVLVREKTPQCTITKNICQESEDYFGLDNESEGSPAERHAKAFKKSESSL